MTIPVFPIISQAESVLVSVPEMADPYQNHPLLRKPPAANRAVNPQDPRIELIPAVDYLTVVLVQATLDQMVELKEEIEAIAGVVFVDIPTRGRSLGTWYESHMNTCDGSLFCYRINESNPEFLDFAVQLSGTACRRAGTSAIAGLIRLIYMWGGHVSRIDINVDDFMGDLTYEDLMAASYEKRFTRFRESDRYDRYNVRSRSGGFTISFGKRSSDRYVRIYDAMAKHGIPAIRFEAEFKGAIAKKIGTMITTITNDGMLSRLLGGILNGTLRITTEARDHNTNRIATHPAWKRFAARLDNPIHVKSPQRECTLERTIRYIRTTVAKPLAKFISYYGKHWADELKGVIKNGRARFDKSDFAMLEGCTLDGFLRFFDDFGIVVDVVGAEHQIRNWLTKEEEDLMEQVPF